MFLYWGLTQDMGKKLLKLPYKTTWLDKFKLVLKHPKAVYIQICLHHDLRGLVEPQLGIKF